MTTKSDRNLSYDEAIRAGLLPIANRRLNPTAATYQAFEDIKEVLNIKTPNPSSLVKINDRPKAVEHWETLAKDIKPEPIRINTEIEKAADSLFRVPKKEALRFDSGKTNWSLMPFEAIEEINKVLEFGAKKYEAWNFTKNGGMNHSRIINSMLRHIFAYMRGQDNDPESGLNHMAHVGCNVVFLLYYNKYPEIFKAKDDRHVS